MTKFEEEVDKVAKQVGYESLSLLCGDCEEANKIYIHFKNWHSDEEFQAEKDARKKEYEIHQDIYSKTSKKLNEAELEIANLKSQLQQQALPVVPEDVDKAIKYLKKHVDSTFIDLCDILTEKGFKWLNDFQFKDRRFGFEGLNNKLFILSHLAITGYTVEKPQLFYLKNKLTGLWLMRDEVDKVYPYDHTTYIGDRDKFTQQEIDSMQTGSYEQIEVTE